MSEFRDFLDFQRTVGAWADATFPNATIDSKMEHLRRETYEVQSTPKDPSEYADVLSLLIHAANSAGVDLFQAAKDKFEVIQLRKWGKPDEFGVVEHIREGETGV